MRGRHRSVAGSIYRKARGRVHRAIGSATVPCLSIGRRRSALGQIYRKVNLSARTLQCERGSVSTGFTRQPGFEASYRTHIFERYKLSRKKADTKSKTSVLTDPIEAGRSPGRPSSESQAWR